MVPFRWGFKRGVGFLWVIFLCNVDILTLKLDVFGEAVQSGSEQKQFPEASRPRASTPPHFSIGLYFTLSFCWWGIMVMAIMIMRFMWIRKKVAITGTIAIQLPCTFIHPGSIVHPLYFATTVEPLLIGTLLKSLSFLPANQSRLHFHLLQPTLFLLFLLVVILKRFFSGGSSLWQVKVPPSLKDLWTPTN